MASEHPEQSWTLLLRPQLPQRLAADLWALQHRHPPSAAGGQYAPLISINHAALETALSTANSVQWCSQQNFSGP